MESTGVGGPRSPLRPPPLRVIIIKEGVWGNYVPPEGGVKGELLVLLIVYV